MGATIEGLFGAVNTLVVSLPTFDLEALWHDRRVGYIVPDRVVHLSAVTISESPGKVPAGIARMRAGPRRHGDGSVEPAGPAGEAAVAFLDTGVTRRSDLNVVGGTDCSAHSREGDDTAGDGTTTDHHGHGTHVAGILGGKGFPGVIGVSPGTPLYAVRVFGADGTGPVSDVICGLDWVTQNAAAGNIKVVNLSFSTPGSDDGNCGMTNHEPLHTAVCRLTDAGVTVIAAAGNDGEDLSRSAPAAYGEVLAVTAMADFDGVPGGFGSPPPDCSTNNGDDTAADYSGYAVPGSANAQRTIAAPGDCITAPWNDRRTKTISGTSMASPHVAGLVVRCIDAGHCAGLSPTGILAKLQATAASRPPDQGFFGDPYHPKNGKYYGYLATDVGYEKGPS